MAIRHVVHTYAHANPLAAEPAAGRPSPAVSRRKMTDERHAVGPHWAQVQWVLRTRA